MPVDGTVVNTLALADVLSWLSGAYLWAKVLIGFSIIIFVHELGHFLAAKWMGVRVDRFAVGFFTRIVGYRKGEGITFGRQPEYSTGELKAKGYGETDYCLNVLPFGGYVKMLGQDDILINEETGEMKTGDDPRSFTNKSVGARMIVVSGGVVFNVLFAVLLYAAVFLVAGKDVIAPRVGHVEADSAAARAGLEPGDRFLEIDGRRVRSFEDIYLASVLGDRTLNCRIERGGEVLDVTLTRDIAEGDKAAIGIAFPSRAEVIAAAQALPGDALQPGDRVTRLDGQPVSTALDVFVAFQASRGRPVRLTVQRADPDEPGQTLEQEVTQRPYLRLRSTQPGDADSPDARHLLGLQRRQMVLRVEPGKAAAKAGVQPGDVIAQWGNVPNPLYRDIIASIHANEGRPIAVVVERDGQPVELSVTPEAPLALFGTPEPKVGVAFVDEDRRPVVAGAVADTPAAALGIPRGSEIVAIDDAPVADWFDVYERLRAAAGGAARVRYRVAGDEVAGDEVAGEMPVPPSIVDALDLPPTAVIVRIDGRETVVLPSGRSVSLQDPAAIRHALERNIGETVTVEYLPSAVDLRMKKGTFEVTAEHVDPWQLRAEYGYPNFAVVPEKVTISAGGNPLTALWLGLTESGRVLGQMYKFLEGLVKRLFAPADGGAGVGVDNVAGPIGIFQFAGQHAAAGFDELLGFLAFISVNLAVINFLPFPVVDGGLMVFLLLEKIRGRPMSLKVQMTTTLIGLVVIVGIFLFVTFQDIARIVGG